MDLMQLVAGVLEVGAGHRPIAQLDGYVPLTVRHVLPGLWPGPPPRVCRAVGQRTPNGDLEVALLIETGPRVRALALRLGHRAGAWRVVALSTDRLHPARLSRAA